MNKQFTANDVRRLSNRIPRNNDEIADAQEALRAYADMIEAQEKAVPVASVRQALTGGYWIDWHGKQMPDYLGCDLYIHPPHRRTQWLTR